MSSCYENKDKAWEDYVLCGGMPFVLELETFEEKSKYLSYFEEAYVLYAAKRYDIKGAKYFSAPLKYYFADIGLRNVRFNFRQVEETHIMENIIYNDLLRRGFKVDVGVVEYFPCTDDKKTRVQLEVDFVVDG